MGLRRLISAIWLIAPLVFAQSGTSVLPETTTLPKTAIIASLASGCPFTDSFPGSGSLSANWTALAASHGAPFWPNSPNGNPVQASGLVEQSSAFDTGSAFVTAGGCTFNEDQYIYANATSWSNGAVLGLWVLASGFTGTQQGYVVTCTVSGGQCALQRYAGNTPTSLSTTCGTLVQGDYLGMAVTGTGAAQAINVYISATTSFGTATCSVTDNTYTSGNPGIWIGNTNSPVTNTQFGPVTAGNGTI